VAAGVGPVQPPHQDVERDARDPPPVEVHAREGRIGVAGLDDVVEPHDRDVVGHAHAPHPQGVHHTEREQV
jgi:hypothetical protein